MMGNMMGNNYNMGNMWNMGMGRWNDRTMGNMMGSNYNNYGMGNNGYMNRMSSNNNWNNQWRNEGWNSNNFGMVNMNMDRKHPQTTYNDADFAVRATVMDKDEINY